MSPTKTLFVVVILPMHDLYKGGKGKALEKNLMRETLLSQSDANLLGSRNKSLFNPVRFFIQGAKSRSCQNGYGLNKESNLIQRYHEILTPHLGCFQIA